MYERVDYRTC